MGLKKKFPWFFVGLLALIVIACLCWRLLAAYDPMYMNLYEANVAPNALHWFGTDRMGRDIFSMIWYGGRISLEIGLISTLISSMIGIAAGCLCALGSPWLDRLLLKGMEIVLSIPSLLLVVLIRSLWDSSSLLGLSLVIGLTDWTSLALVVRMEVKSLRVEPYYEIAYGMGASKGHLFLYHLFPNFFSSIVYMIVMNVRNAIVFESTLSFMGLGIPLEMISWGSMLSMADQAFLSNSWWVLIIPGFFLVLVIVCLSEIGEYLRQL